MLNLTHPFNVDFNKFQDNISCEGAKIYVDIEKYLDKLGHLEALRDAAYVNVSDQMLMLSNGRYSSPTPQKLVSTLLEFCEIQSKEIEKYNKDSRMHKPSADQEVLTECCRRLRLEMDSGHISYLREKGLRLMEDYIAYRGILSAASSANKKISRFVEMPEAGWGGTDIAAVDFMYEQKSTMRYYTFDDNIQGWNSEFLSCMTVPSGYYLWWGDMKQIDLRVFMYSILLQKDPKLRDFIREYDDKYEAFMRYVYKELDRVFDYSEFKLNRDKYKKGILACLYGIQENSLTVTLDGDRQMARMFMEFFRKNKAYVELNQNIEDTIHMGCGVNIYDYFGVRSSVETYGSKATPHVISQCINRPNQCGSNSVIVMWTNAVMEKFRELGYGKDDIYVYLVRHDEVIFAMKKEVLKNTWIFDDYAKVQVDDWELLEMESGFGIYYTEDLKELEDRFKESCDKNRDRYTPRSIGEHVDYAPLQPIVKAVMYSGQRPAEFYTRLTKVDVTDDKEALHLLQQKALESKSHVGERCSSYLKYRGKIAYYNPHTKEWMFNRPMNEIFDIESGGILLYNSTNNGDEFRNNKLIHFVHSDADQVIGCLEGDKRACDRALEDAIRITFDKPRAGWGNVYRD